MHTHAHTRTHTHMHLNYTKQNASITVRFRVKVRVLKGTVTWSFMLIIPLQVSYFYTTTWLNASSSPSSPWYLMIVASNATKSFACEKTFLYASLAWNNWVMGNILCLGKAMALPSHINTKPCRNIYVTLTSYQHQQKNSDIQTSRIQINAGMSCIKTACGQHAYGKTLWRIKERKRIY